jgi:putative ABC transport system permease protein
MLLNRLKKSKSLRIVNLLGLSVIFGCMTLSYAYIKKEWSYDRFHQKADRIVRLSLRYGNEPVDGRIHGLTMQSPLLAVPEIEDAVLLTRVNTGVLTLQGKPHVVNNIYFATANFFDVFDFKLSQGDPATALDAPAKAVIGESHARRLFGEDSPIGKEIQLSGRQFDTQTVFITGVFEDFPENSHFHTGLIVHRPDNRANEWTYAYLLLNSRTGIDQLQQSLALPLDELNGNNPRKASPHLLPLTDIHLHSRMQQELEPNGNILFIHAVAGANLLLLSIVLFNLWLNAGLIFAYNRRYYQLLRLNGAMSSTVFKDECLLALALGCAAMSVAVLSVCALFPAARQAFPSGGEMLVLCLFFLLLVTGISLLPVAAGMSATLFLNTDNDTKPVRFSLSGIRFMLVAQYGMVMFIVILGVGISRQMNLIKTSQAGGREQSILVMKEQPDAIKERYGLLKAELLKYPEVEAVTSAMQLPGSSIADAVRVWREGEAEAEGRSIPVLVVGEDFLPFFTISPVNGAVFRPSARSFDEEEKLFYDFLDEGKMPPSPLTEEYVVNRKALQLLGFASPEEAVGAQLYLASGVLGYVNRGTIAGVTGDFTYTTAYEESIPQILLQRNMFQHCIMVRLSPGDLRQSLATFNRVWKEVNPDYPADYAFLHDVYAEVYHSEMSAESLVHTFALLSLAVATMGLIVIMAFVVKRKTREIGIRKIHGATAFEITRMLNLRFLICIAMAFPIAAPAAFLAMRRWLEGFALKTRLEWWLFAAAGVAVLLVSVVSISRQTWRAANLNPVDALKTD